MAAVRRLQLVNTEDEAPTPRPPAPGIVRVAIATRDMKGLNAHFGSAPKFAIYDVTKEGWDFVEAVGFGDTSDETGSHKTDGDDRIGPKVEALAGCHLLFCLAIGGPAAAKVVAAHIHPVKLSKPEPIDSIISRVQTMMSGNPPPWLRKVMGAQTARSMDFLDEE